MSVRDRSDILGPAMQLPLVPQRSWLLSQEGPSTTEFSLMSLRILFASLNLTKQLRTLKALKSIAVEKNRSAKYNTTYKTHREIESMLVYLSMIDSLEGTQKFEVLYLKHRQLMFYIANKILMDTKDSEDVVHDSFLKIIGILDKIVDPESPQTRALIVTITENKAIDLYRKRKSKKIVSFDEEYLGVPDQDVLRRVEDIDLFTKAMATLPNRYRDILLLRYSHGYTVDEISDILSMKNENVKKTIQRARKKLGEILEEEGW